MKKGYQLFSAWQKCMNPEGLKNVIRQISEIGYDGVEFFMYAGIPAEEMKALLTECGIEAFNSHVQLERWEEDADFEISYAKALGMTLLTVPFIAPEERTKKTIDRLSEMIPLWSKKCKEQGITLCYHNHDFEYEKLGAEYLLDKILGFDADLVLELDTFWTYYAGINPAEEMERRKNRLKLIHIKDYTDLKQKPFPAFSALGTGKMDNDPIVGKARELGLEWIVVEQDNSPIDELESAKISFETMNTWF